MSQFVRHEVDRILSPFKKKGWDSRLPKGLRLFLTKRPRRDPIERYTAKARGRTGAAVRFHVVNSTRDTTERKRRKQRHGR